MQTVMRGLVGVAATAVVGAFAAPSAMSSAPSAMHTGAHRLEIGLFGDMPYGDFGRAQYPAVLRSMNDARLDFSIFNGDIKSGSEPCYANFDGSAAAAGKPDVYRYAKARFNRLAAPVVVLPGDNEWTDCDRTKVTPNFDAVGRLEYLRRVFYPTAESLGQRTVTLNRQGSRYPENVRWRAGGVMFVGLNVPGSDNNWVDPQRDGTAEGPAAEAQAEYRARNRANLAWLRGSFAAAEEFGAKAILVAIQADMWDPNAAAAGKLVHYADTKAELARLTIKFGKPVLLVNGDSHNFVVDKPLTDAAATNAAGEEGPNVVQNFTRVTTFGEAQNHWVSVTVEDTDPNVFTVHQRLVRANLPAYTAPAAG
ncbi:MAG TPA: hypothetical protein VFJ97_08890 [Dermatophilaceae bacterium]|nr:hypothetical protein [Dermatophilaceae bacterium]